MASPGGRATPGKPFTVISAAYVKSRIARFWRTGNRNSSGFSSMNRVVQLPARKSALESKLSRNGMLVFTPRTRNSSSAAPCAGRHR